jgi:hypothetical protein
MLSRLLRAFNRRADVSLPEAWRQIAKSEVIRDRAGTGSADPNSPRTASIVSIDRGQMRVNVQVIRASDSEFGG